MPKNDKEVKPPMHNITINLSDCYDDNIQKLIKMGLIANRSEAIRTALREFLQKEYNINLPLLEFFNNNNNKKSNSSEDNSPSELKATNKSGCWIIPEKYKIQTKKQKKNMNGGKKE